MNDQIRQTINPAFRFVVDIGGQRLAAFTECSVPVIEWETEELKEGGLNTFTHQLPGRRKSARLTLKNGVGNKPLFEWYVKTMSEKFERKQVTVSLLNARKQAVMIWNLQGALPTKWTGPQLKANDNSIAIQTLELVCGEITVSL
jgi:phage tail-like protein